MPLWCDRGYNHPMSSTPVSYPLRLTRIPGSPVVDADRRATFTVHAPDAREVVVVNQSDPEAMGAAEYPMTQDAEGVWTVTTNPCRPGFHYYQLRVDGFHGADPRAEHFFGWARWSSGLEVPDPDFDFHEPRDTPRGDVRMHWYRSQVTGETRRCLVYTPPGYDTEPGHRFPVLHLQHGSGEGELSWTMQGRANFILDNLIAEGRAVPMIVVMDNGYAPAPDAENRTNPRGDENFFEQLMVEDLVPEIDRSYRTVGTREARAITGLSMGAGQAQRIGFAHLDLFASIGGFSGGARDFDLETTFGGVFRDPDDFHSRVKLYWFGCGDLDRGFERGKAMHEALEAHGIRHHWHEMHGSHEWRVWRHHLHAFAPLLFR